VSLSRRVFLSSSAAAISAMTAGPAIIAGLPARAAANGWTLPPKTPFTVKEGEWIVMKDGTHLAARLWIPDSAQHDPAPVVWEYIPYRLRDAYRFHDDLFGPLLAQYGIVYARVDARGSGNSEGVIVDEYLAQELDDGVECIAWLARQPWSNGAVGMRGISWGGINTLQVAALAPPQLKAIMPMGCCDDRYTDDAHYIGGEVGLTNFQWGVGFKNVMAGPPDPEIVGPHWEDMWRRRLDSAPAILEKWMSHQRYDSFWKHGSIATDYAAIQCPVYVVDGWIDTYSNVVGRLLEHLKTPRKGLVGPWGHAYPDFVSPGPGLDWTFEEVRWWHQWLKGVDTGIMDEPMFRAYMPETTPWEVYPKDIAGRWVAETAWPSPDIRPTTFYLTKGQLSPAPGEAEDVKFVGDKIIGLTKPEWLPFPPGGMPVDQTPDDKKSLVFDSAPLDADLEILGYPVAKIRVAADAPVAMLTVRLTEVKPDGKSWLVSYKLRNLTHRISDENPTPLEPGRAYDVEIPLFMVGHRFSKGSRIRVALCESLWPLVWPSPRIATLTIGAGVSSIVLPVRPRPAEEAPFPIPLKPGIPASMAGRHPEITVTGPDAHGKLSIRRVAADHASTIKDIGTTMSGSWHETLDIVEGDPNSAVWTQRITSGWKRGDWDCTLVSTCEIRSTVDEFHLKESLQAKKGDKVIFEREKSGTVKRDLM
jgi:predicted acyl esterase